MLSEAIEMYSQDKFDFDGHIDVFLHTSAMYLGINEGLGTARSNRTWQPNPATLSQEVRYA